MRENQRKREPDKEIREIGEEKEKQREREAERVRERKRIKHFFIFIFPVSIRPFKVKME